MQLLDAIVGAFIGLIVIAFALHLGVGLLTWGAFTIQDHGDLLIWPALIGGALYIRHDNRKRTAEEAARKADRASLR